MTISYNGRDYAGWQKQKNANTIEEQVEKAIEIITKEKVNCVASGRTDAGVSAYAQTVHFDIEHELDTNKFLHSINGILPNTIRVLNIVESDIHARFSAKRKTYMYKMYLSGIDLPLYTDAFRVNESINIKEMKKFINTLIGAHDFAGFRASGSESDTSIRTIYKTNLKKQDKYLYFFITGNGFLYKMVRNIVGTMIKIGEGKLELKKIKPILFTTFKSVHTAKPEFLYLKSVEYK